MQTRMNIESIGKNKRGWPKKKSQKISEEQESSRLPRRSHQKIKEFNSSAEEGCICTKEDGGRQRIAVTGTWGVDVRKEVKEDVKRLYSAEKDYDCRGGVVGSNIVPRRAMNLRIKKGKRATR